MSERLIRLNYAREYQYLASGSDSLSITANVFNRALAQKLTITGTPGLIIGDQVQRGVMTLDALKVAVASVRAQKVATAQ